MPEEQNNQNNQHGYIATPGNVNYSGDLEQLSLKFASFRRKHKPRMRIAEELREAVFETIGKGVPDKLVQEACRISSEQLNRWREIQRLRGRGKAVKKAKPRVFKVVDTRVEKRAPNSQEEKPSAPVQIRIGGWEICLRQIER